MSSANTLHQASHWASTYPPHSQENTHGHPTAAWFLKCPHCPYETECQTLLRSHITQEHPENFPFSCKLCDKRYRSKHGLKLHMDSHMGKKFKCPLCDQNFTQKTYIKPHLKAVHDAMLCLVCSQVFPVGKPFDDHSRGCYKAF